MDWKEVAEACGLTLAFERAIIASANYGRLDRKLLRWARGENARKHRGWLILSALKHEEDFIQT